MLPSVQGLIRNQFIRFLVVGGINTLFGYSVYALSLFLGFHYSLAAVISTILGVLFNFKTTGRIVFNNRNNWLLFKFIGVYAVTCLVNILALKIFNHYSVDLYLAGFVLLFPSALLAFFLNKKFVFSA
jgi:putative flippase GtrA